MQKLTETVARIINDASHDKAHLLIAIDGRCASGKTTLAAQLGNICDCNVIHLDHFFLRPEQRTAKRLNVPGENVDHERFLEEVLLPLRDGKNFAYRPFDCEKLELSEPIQVLSKPINIIEGAYSCHSSLWDYYDLRIFLNVSPDEQLKRITLRNGKKQAEVFRSRWIPLEEAYFSTFGIAARCDYRFTT